MSSRLGAPGAGSPPPEATGPCPSESSLLAYVQRDDGPSERAPLEAHLSRCDECRALVSLLARSSLVIAGEPPASSPPGETLPPREPEPPAALAIEGLPCGNLVGRYRIERPLGRGGMGMVVMARHEPLGHPVAVKFLLPQTKPSPDVVRRFLREARAAAQIPSEHIARVLDFGTVDPGGAPYLVMEYLEGSDLAGLLKERGPLPVDEAVGYVLQACEALALAHARGVVHRDLKPANLFLTRRPDGEPLVKVLDFGISKHAGPEAGDVSTLTSGGAFLGSPRYMSPEQMQSARDVDARTDLWSLGVILYELVIGRAPFQADTLQALCMVVMTAPAPSMPGVPEPLARAVASCLSKGREGRFSDVAGLVRALRPLAPAWALAAADRVERLAAASRPSVPSTPPSMPDAHAPTVTDGVHLAPSADAPKVIAPSAASKLAQASLPDGTEPGHEAPKVTPAGRSPFARAWLATGAFAALGVAAIWGFPALNRGSAETSALSSRAPSLEVAPSSPQAPPLPAPQASASPAEGAASSTPEPTRVTDQAAPSSPERSTKQAPSRAPSRGKVPGAPKAASVAAPTATAPPSAAAPPADATPDAFKRRGLTDRKLPAGFRPRLALRGGGGYQLYAPDDYA